MSDRPEVSAEELHRFLDGEITTTRAKEIEDAMAASDELKRRLEDARALRADLGAYPSELFDVDFARIDAAIDEQSGVRAGSSRPPWRVRLAVGAAGLAVAAALLLMVRTDFLVDTAGDGVRAKSSQVETDPNQRWAGVRAFRATPGGAEPVADTIAADDSLMFAFTNNGPSPFSHLAIFAVDKQANVFWYYPAYLNAQEDPSSVVVSAEVDAPLDKQVRHAFSEGPLAIYGLFTRAPVNVSTVERQVAQWKAAGSWDVRAPARIKGEGDAQHILKLTVTATP